MEPHLGPALGKAATRLRTPSPKEAPAPRSLTAGSQARLASQLLSEGREARRCGAAGRDPRPPAPTKTLVTDTSNKESTGARAVFQLPHLLSPAAVIAV